MDNSYSRLLILTPLILSAVAGPAYAQETTVAALNAPVVSATSQRQDQSSVSLNLSVPAAATYTFSVPANAAVRLRVDGATVIDLTTMSGRNGDAVKALVTLDAGMHVVDVSGDRVTDGQLAAITINQVGMPGVSLASLVDAARSGADPRGATSVAVARANPSSTSISDSKSQAVSSATAEVMPNAPGVATASARLGTVPGSGGGIEREESGGVARSAIRGAVSAILASRAPSGNGQPTAPAGEAVSSPLSPPGGVSVTQAVQIVGGASREGVVAETGQTLFGGVMDPATYDTVQVTIAQSDRAFTVDVGANSGQFAVRLFPEDLATGEATVTLTGMSSSNAGVMTAPVTYEYTVGPVNDGLTQALSRMTYGPSADLYARVRSMGFNAYVNEQLNPGSIRDASFTVMDVDRMLEDTTTNTGAMFRSLMRHNLAHAAFTDKQLNEVMGEFWSNHFHASTKGSSVTQQNIVDRQFFRDNAMGRFEDLLLYSARSPLMSQFLDNDQSRVGRLNENYGREVLELHTVGVNAGYGDEDVIAVSRVFTGWNYRQTNPGAEGVARLYEFEFRANNHDTEDKVIPFLNTTIAGRSGDAGVQEGEELIRILANDPRTQNYVCGKIVQHFVADIPPAAFVDLCVTAWQASDGSSREILRAILTAPAFIENVELQRTKGKTPYEYAASAIRALGARPDRDDTDGSFYDRFREASEDAGYAPLYFPVPTGLPEVGRAWVNSAAMIAQYREITNVVERPDEYNIDLATKVRDAGLETAEEVAAYLLTIATADRYTLEEYEALVSVLKGNDGIFDMSRDESSAFNRAAGMLIVMPSFKLQ